MQANTYPLVGRATASSYHSSHTSSEGMDVFTVVVQRPMALTGPNGSLEMMLHRRLEYKTRDPRGDDDTVMDDSVLIGFLEEGEWSLVTKFNHCSSSYYEWTVLLLEEAPAVSSRMMSLFQAPPTVHFALLDGTPSDIKGAWTKTCGDLLQWMPSNNVIPRVWFSHITQSESMPVIITIYALREWKLLI